MKMKKLFKYLNWIHYYSVGKQLVNNVFYVFGQNKSKEEYLKNPDRTEVLNYLISFLDRDTCYLEIGVRNPEDNFNKIKASLKYSVDPGLEYKINPVDFKLTSDEFFEGLGSGKLFNSSIKFDVIFIDGLHLASQVDRDIENALKFIKEDGFIVLHDCNPPTEWHARETFDFNFSPAGGFWNGTTWKAFLKRRFDSSLKSCCIDGDWGVGILSKSWPIGNSIASENLFFEFSDLNKNRIKQLNLITFESLKMSLK